MVSQIGKRAQLRRLWHSVRLRLLVLALVPLIILTPLLLMIGMARFSADYDALLISNVESDLRIARQYLDRITKDIGDDVAAEARSAGLLGAAGDSRGAYLDAARARLGLDFLRYVPMNEVQLDWPVVATARAGRASAGIDVMEPDQLAAQGGDLAARARIVPRSAAEGPETRGMVLHAAAPVLAEEGAIGVLVGGILLNRNLVALSISLFQRLS